jgi:signal transduction histidine kinase
MEEVSELQMLRSRLVIAGLAERRRIERALHDGAQQDLIALSVELQLMRGLVSTDPTAALASLDRIQQEVRATLGRLQALGNEIYPGVLDVRGLADALRQVVRPSETAAFVDAGELGRYPAELEAAVFFLWRTVLDGIGPNAKARILVTEESQALQVAIEAAVAIDVAPASDLVAAAGGVLTVKTEPGGCRIDATFRLD